MVLFTLEEQLRELGGGGTGAGILHTQCDK